MSEPLDVHVVTPDREVWSGEAKYVIARAAGGDLGVLPGHEPVLSVLRPGRLRIELLEGPDFEADVDGGFLSVATTAGVTRVDVLAEHVTTA